MDCHASKCHSCIGVYFLIMMEDIHSAVYTSFLEPYIP
jgi:hypothetical protein